jgi:hypothetical protein
MADQERFKIRAHVNGSTTTVTRWELTEWIDAGWYLVNKEDERRLSGEGFQCTTTNDTKS